MQIYSSVVSDVGTKKNVNQDAIMLKIAEGPMGETVVLAVLCDGLGGLSCGEEASAAFIAAMEQWFSTSLSSILSGEGKTEQLNPYQMHIDYRKDIRLSWERLVHDANERIGMYGKTCGFELGTTAVCFLLIGDDFLLMHVGDSRLYKMTDLPDSIRQLTHDHSLIQRQLDSGEITGDEASHSSYRSVLLQCIGASPEVRPDFFFGNVTRNSNYILCTDGFWRTLSMDELEETFSPQVCNSEEEAERRLDRTIEIIKKRGEEDNISAILIGCNMTQDGQRCLK